MLRERHTIRRVESEKLGGSADSEHADGQCLLPPHAEDNVLIIRAELIASAEFGTLIDKAFG